MLPTVGLLELIVSCSSCGKHRLWLILRKNRTNCLVFGLFLRKRGPTIKYPLEIQMEFYFFILCLQTQDLDPLYNLVHGLL